jgi:hypothetical protein
MLGQVVALLAPLGVPLQELEAPMVRLELQQQPIQDQAVVVVATTEVLSPAVATVAQVLSSYPTTLSRR